MMRKNRIHADLLSLVQNEGVVAPCTLVLIISIDGFNVSDLNIVEVSVGEVTVVLSVEGIEAAAIKTGRMI